MVCIAAFIILILVGLAVAFISIFKRDFGRAYLKTLKKAWGCVWKKVRLQKCETNFKDDVKNTLLKKIVLKHPTWVKPLSITIEIASILLVLITIWSIIEAAKAGLALWVFGTCNVSQPSSCALGAEVCSIDQEEPSNPIEATGRWFGEWGEIFGAIPDRLQHWNAADYTVSPDLILNPTELEKPLALDVLDPGCSVCMQVYKEHLEDTEFRAGHTIVIMVYPIELPDGSYKFKNSGIIARYIHALTLSENPDYHQVAIRILTRIFTEYNSDHINYQTVFNENLNPDQAEMTLQEWLVEFNIPEEDIKSVIHLAHSEHVTKRMAQIKEVVENKIHAKGIPTLIYDGKKHSGLR